MPTEWSGLTVIGSHFAGDRMRKRSGFTLVELLVVIGIIALLISILLPSLNRARQSANNIKCQSNLRQVGQLLAFYLNSSKGYAPHGRANKDLNTGVDFPYTGSPPPVPWYWQDTLSLILDKRDTPYTGAIHNVKQYASVFRDVDTVGAAPGNSNGGFHYMGNPRIFAAVCTFDPYSIKWSSIYKVTNIKGSSNVYVAFDGAQDLASFNLACPDLALGIDNFKFFYAHSLYSPGPPGQYTAPDEYSRLIALGSNSDSGQNTPSAIKKANRDFNSSTSDSFNFTTVRYRHIANTTANFLALDGHVDSRRIGDLTVKDMCVPR